VGEADQCRTDPEADAGCGPGGEKGSIVADGDRTAGDDRGRVTDIVEKLADPPTTLVTTGCYVGTPALFDALELLRPSDRGEYELTDGIGVLVRAGRTVGTVPLRGQRVNVNRSSDIERAEAILDSGSS